MDKEAIIAAFEREKDANWIEELLEVGHTSDLVKWLMSGGERMTPEEFWRCRYWRDFLRLETDAQRKEKARAIVLKRLAGNPDHPKRKGKIKLADGRIAWIRSIEQDAAYSFILEGYPDAEANTQYLDGLAKRIASNNFGAQPYMIEPRRLKGDEIFGANYFDKKGDYSYDAELLPRVQVVANLVSGPTAKDPWATESTLTVIWFQGDFVFPIDRQIKREIQSIDWDLWAENFVL